jgi:hypothetical protein
MSKESATGCASGDFVAGLLTRVVETTFVVGMAITVGHGTGERPPEFFPAPPVTQVAIVLTGSGPSGSAILSTGGWTTGPR